MSGQHSFDAPSLYPPQQNILYPAMNSTSTLETKLGEDPRQISRTPSPTPSELKELKTGAIDWETLKRKSFWFRREWLCAYPFSDQLGALADMNLRRVLRDSLRAGGNHCISHDLPSTDRRRFNTCDEVATWVSGCPL